MMKAKKLAPAKSGQPQAIENLKDESCMVIGNIAANPSPVIKTSGIRTRGNGCATKGKMARGPMA
tara:strand:+ start:355 stop:549 length:195 start_codon:yes stop_codon:yes gene_type:complete